MFPISNAVPSRYPPVVTWALIAANCVVFLFQIGLSPTGQDEFLLRFALIPARYVDLMVGGDGSLTPADFFPIFTNLPVFVPGALFSVGDGHAAQGDGEVNVNAIETGLIGTFELHVRTDMALDWPMAETPTHLITMGFDTDLDDAVVIALRNMINLLSERMGISREDAYSLCSMAADLRVTQVVNSAKGIHMMFEKKYLGAT